MNEEGMETLELDSYFDRKYIVQTVKKVEGNSMSPLKDHDEKL